MSDTKRIRHRYSLYETAFDSSVEGGRGGTPTSTHNIKTEPTTPELDKLANSPILRLSPRLSQRLSTHSLPGSSKECPGCSSLVRSESENPGLPRTLLHETAEDISVALRRGLHNLRLEAITKKSTEKSRSASSTTPSPLIFGSGPTPPSSLPLPLKFGDREMGVSVLDARSAPNISSAALISTRPNILRPPPRYSCRETPKQSVPSPVPITRSSRRYSSSESITTQSSTSDRSVSGSISSLDSLRSGCTSSFTSYSESLTLPMRPSTLMMDPQNLLSPISDKSQEPMSETSDLVVKKPGDENSGESVRTVAEVYEVPVKCERPQGFPSSSCRAKRRPLSRPLSIVKNIVHHDAEIQGSDSGISIESQGGSRSGTLGHDFHFDMPKLRRRSSAAAVMDNSVDIGAKKDTETSTESDSSGGALDYKSLPFDMPKLRRKFQQQQQQSISVVKSSVVSPVGQSLSFSFTGNPVDPRATSMSMPLSPIGSSPTKRRPTLSLNFGCNAPYSVGEKVNIEIPLERQGWYHGAITRKEAEVKLRSLKEGSYLVRNSESSRQDYILSLKSACGFMHMRIARVKSENQTETKAYNLGEFSDLFSSVPKIVEHFSIQRLPIRGAEHMCLLHPVIEQLL